MKLTFNNICVFCGSGRGAKPEYIEQAVKLGRILAENGIGLVYGGARVGIMGEIASAVMKNGGRVTGIIPKHLFEKEVAYTDLPDLRVVDSMHERKALMAELSDGFIALPGGYGTIEEIFEAITWAQLGLHFKPCGFLNICGYYDRLMDFLDAMAAGGFIRPENREMLLIDNDPEGLLGKFSAYKAPVVDKAKWALEMLKK
jgi:uncharacterized protein (TIGR00730 family)